MSWYYPPGHPTGDRHSEVELVCSNEKCENLDERVTVTQIYERDTGAAYFDPEDADICEFCGDEMSAT